MNIRTVILKEGLNPDGNYYSKDVLTKAATSFIGKDFLDTDKKVIGKVIDSRVTKNGLELEIKCAPHA